MGNVDVTDWQAAGDEQLGTKPKQWLRDPDDALWLWKESTFNHDALGRRYRKGDDWSEVVASRLGLALGIPVARVELARFHGRFGVISLSVIDDPSQDLAHGNELLAEVGVPARDPRDRSGYTVEAIASALAQVGAPTGHDSLEGAFDWFVGYMVLDALIGNTDRHQDNWAAIRASDGRRLSPSFDHASSLGFLLSDAERQVRLSTSDGGHTAVAYAARARSKFEGSPHPADVVVAGLDLASGPARSHWARVISKVPPLDVVLEAVPRSRMSDAARRFALALYEQNRSVLSDAVRRMVS